MRNVAKEVFLNTLTCPNFGWLTRAGKLTQKTASLGDEFRMRQGKEIGRRAQQIYPNGIIIDNRDIIHASKKTKDLMNDLNVSVVFEGNRANMIM